MVWRRHCGADKSAWKALLTTWFSFTITTLGDNRIMRVNNVIFAK